MKKDLRLLIDADIVVYTACLACEESIDWGDDVWTLHCHMEQVRTVIDNEIRKLMSILEVPVESCELFLTGKDNFRKNVLPTYKGGRKDTRKPVCFNEARKYVRDMYYAKVINGIEADDAIGIMATMYPDDTCIVSKDKDLKTIPGTHFDYKEEKIYTILPVEAEYNFLKQTLTGDQTDGYLGCPGIGPKRAHEILDNCDQEGTSRWKAVVEAFAKKGYDESFALTQARMAYILQKDQFNGTEFTDGCMVIPNLWTPND